MGTEEFKHPKETVTVEQETINETRSLDKEIDKKMQEIDALKNNITDDEALNKINKVFEEYRELTDKKKGLLRKLEEVERLGDDEIEEV